METIQRPGPPDAAAAAANSAFGRWAKYPSGPVQTVAQTAKATIGNT